MHRHRLFHPRPILVGSMIVMLSTTSFMSPAQAGGKPLELTGKKWSRAKMPLSIEKATAPIRKIAWVLDPSSKRILHQ